MSESFDAYHEWLGISPKERPPNYYDLLGIESYESNSRVITNALNRQKLHLQSLKATENPELCQQLLDEIREAADCLSDPTRRAKYDAALQAQNETNAFNGVVDSRSGSEQRRIGLSFEIFRKLVIECGLLSNAEVETARRCAMDQVAVRGADALADELVRLGSLTRFQADMILSGRNRGLVFADYVVRKPIGAGAMGEVFEAVHRTMQRKVAIKVLGNTAIQNLQSLDAVKRFKREITAAARLHHPNVVTAYDAGELDGLYYLVMEYIDGVDLSRQIKLNGPLSLGVAIRAVFETACGLNYVHEAGVVHRDIKPSNLMIAPDRTIKILDLSVASLRDDSLDTTSATSVEHLTSQGQIIGTAHFMSPEQANDPRRSDGRSDIYSLGCTLYYLLTANLPFVGNTLPQVLVAHREDPIPSLAKARPDVPPWFDALFTRMVAKRPEDRFQSMKEVMLVMRNGVATARHAPQSPEVRTPNREATEFDRHRENEEGSQHDTPYAEQVIGVRVNAPPVQRQNAPNSISELDTTEISAESIDTLSPLCDPLDILSPVEPASPARGQFAFHGMAQRQAERIIRVAVLFYILVHIVDFLAVMLVGAQIDELFPTPQQTLIWLSGVVIPAAAAWFFAVPFLKHAVSFVAQLVKKPWSVPTWQFKFFRSISGMLYCWGAALAVWLVFRMICLTHGSSGWIISAFLAIELGICVWLISLIIQSFARQA